MQILQNLNLAVINSKINAKRASKDGLMSGNLGVVLYNFYVGNLNQDIVLMEKGGELLESVFEDFNDNNSSLKQYPFSYGWCGLGYLLTLLQKDALLELDVTEILTVLDTEIYKCGLEEIKGKQVDFLHQATGILHYFNARLPDAEIAGFLENLVDALIANGISDRFGFRYLSSFGHHANEKFDLGLAHGLSGMLMVLINLYNSGIRQQKISSVLEEGARFILSFKRNENKDNDLSHFAVFVDQSLNSPIYSNRLAWCYGDLNELLLLYKLYPILKDKNLLKIADEVGAATCKRKNLTENQVVDSHFCHGAAGIAQTYKTLHELSGKEMYLEAYEYWIEKTKELLVVDLEKGTYKGKEHELLEGLGGVGLVLASYESKKKLNWSELFLLS